MSRPAILIYEKNILRAARLREIVDSAGYGATTVFYSEEAQKVASKKRFDLLIASFDSFPLPAELEGMKIIISAPDNRYLEVDKLSRRYNSPCITYPYVAERVAAQIADSLLGEESLRAEPSEKAEAFGGILGNSQPVRDLRELLATAAKVSSRVLLLGETGTGKELAARALQMMGPRKRKPFIAVNCGGLAETLLETELFGHEKGAFTGAVKGRAGKFEAADNGTLFLDEIGDMPLSFQAKLLRVLESGSFYRVGAETPIKVDVRLVCATNRDIFELTRTGLFRLDLLYRLNVIRIDLPPLRERGDDIALLASHFLENFRKKLKKPTCRFSQKVLGKMQGYAWPGNVRQLQHSVERAVVKLKGDVIENIDFGIEAVEPPDAPPDIGRLQKLDFAGMQSEVLAHYEKEYVKAVLTQTGGSIQQTCDRCKMDRKTLYLKMKIYGLDKKDFK